MKEKISIVIRTLNEEKYLDQLLCSIESQRCSYNLKVVVVDSGSVDSTLEIAKQHKCKLVHIKKHEFTFGRSLNIGCLAIKSDYLVFISGHCVPVNGSWLERLVNPIKNKIVDYSYGRQIGGPETYWSERKIFEKYFPSESCIPQKGFYCNNANSAISYEVWEEFRFDEELTGLEDMFLAKKLIKKGKKIGYVADAQIYHYHNESWDQIKNRFERESLALKTICPEIDLRKRDVIFYFFSSIIADLKSSYMRKDFKFLNILLYRFYQYYGSYSGNKKSTKLSFQSKESYFYPTLEKGKALEPSDQEIKSLEYVETKKRKIVALLPMKAHSERIPNKNFKKLNGKPLFRWVLDTLMEVESIDLIVINTDARDILKKHNIVDSNRILIRDRPQNICGDFVSMNDVIENDLKNIDADIFLMTHTTNPLLSKSTINEALNRFLLFKKNDKCDSLFTVDRIQTRFYKEDSTPVNHNPDILVRTQDLETWYEENSNLYIFDKNSFAKRKARIGIKPSMFVTPKIESLDIDNPEDWILAESLIKFKSN